MALPAISTTEFTGIIKISGNTFLAERLQAVIDFEYPDLVRSLIGSKALIDVTDNAITQKYTDLFEGVDYYNIEQEKYIRAVGLLTIIRYLIYFRWVREHYTPTVSGNVKSEAEVSTRQSSGENASTAAAKWNLGAIAFNDYTIPFIENYEDFVQAIDSITDNGGSSYTINTTETLYLEDGDTVVIGAIEYVVSNVIAGTSFDVTGSDPTGYSSYISNPFEELDFCEMEYIV